MRLLARLQVKSLSVAFFASLLMVASPSLNGCEKQSAEAPPTATSQTQSNVSIVATPAGPAGPPTVADAVPPGPPPAMANAEQLQDLVSPIALYPDVLVAQILAGSTYPTQVVEAARWIMDHPNLAGDQLAAAVNPQPWDPSIKSLTQFPSVLQTMNESLAWTSELGEAYFNQPADVMNAIQTMRNRAINAGTLKNTPQQKVEVQLAVAGNSGSGQGSSTQQTVIIQPAQASTVYVPQYNPAAVYGAPVQAPPGYPGSEMLATGLLSFGAGILVASLINNNNNDWNCNWHGGSVKYNNNVYVSRTNVVPGRGYYPAGNYQRPPYASAYPPRRYPASGYPRPAPYPATRAAYNGAVPSTRPYDPAQAKRYAANNPNPARPNFPKAATLPNNPAVKNLNRTTAQNPAVQPANLPSQKGNRPKADRSANNRLAANQPATGNRGGDSMRGYGDGGNTRGGRAGALGGAQPAGVAQASSDRGRASMRGKNNRQSQGALGAGGGQRTRAGGGGGGGRRR
jgi:Protein of unknown function (DUF3300)